MKATPATKPLCVIWVTPVFLGIQDFLLKGVDVDKGMPGSYNVIKALADAGHKVVIMVEGAAGKTAISVRENITTYKCGCPAWMKRVRLGPIKTILTILFAVRQGRRLATIHKADVVYGHDSFGAAVGYCLGKLLGLPNLTRIYGSTLYGVCDGRMSLSIWLKHWDQILPFVLPTRQMIITQDGTGAEKIAAMLKVNKGRIHCWLNGVDKTLYQPYFDGEAFKAQVGLPPGAKMLISVSRLEGWKRVDRLIATLAPLLRKRKDTYLVIVGEGMGRHMLEMLCVDLNVKHKTIFTGRLSRPQVIPFLNSADVFLALYDYSNLSNSLLEAMACGRCVVALDVGTTARVVKHGENGFLVPVEEMGCIPGLVDALLSDPTTIMDIGTRARQFIESDVPTWDERVAREICLIEHPDKSSA